MTVIAIAGGRSNTISTTSTWHISGELGTIRGVCPGCLQCARCCCSDGVGVVVVVISVCMGGNGSCSSDPPWQS